MATTKRYRKRATDQRKLSHDELIESMRESYKDSSYEELFVSKKPWPRLDLGLTDPYADKSYAD